LILHLFTFCSNSLQFNILCPQMDMTPYFEGRLENHFFFEKGPSHNGRELPPISQRTSVFQSWESRLPSIVNMIHGCDSDIVCLQEVQCSNASCAEPKSEPLIGANTTEKLKKDEVPKIIERIKGFLNSSFLAETPASLIMEHKKLCAVLNAKVLEPGTIIKNQKHLKLLYANPTPQNVKIVILKKIKIPIFVDGKALDAKSKDHPPAEGAEGTGATKTRDKRAFENPIESKNQSIKETELEKKIASKNQSIEELVLEKKWLQAIAFSDKPVEQRRRDLLRDSNGFKQAVQKGTQYFLLVVVKAGTLQQGCSLEYVLPELPVYQQKRTLITVQRIIDLNHYDSHGVREAKVKCVESLSVSGSDLESVAMIQVFPPASAY
jgi:hypothetical protein